MQFTLFIKREKKSFGMTRHIKLAEAIEYHMLNKRTIYWTFIFSFQK